MISYDFSMIPSAKAKMCTASGPSVMGGCLPSYQEEPPSLVVGYLRSDCERGFPKNWFMNDPIFPKALKHSVVLFHFLFGVHFNRVHCNVDE
jgi:hypothetical protein